MNVIYTFEQMIECFNYIVKDLESSGYVLHPSTMSSDSGHTKLFVDMYHPSIKKLMRIRFIDVTYDGHIGYLIEVRKYEICDFTHDFYIVQSEYMPLVTAKWFLKIESGKNREKYVVSDNLNHACDLLKENS